MQVESRVLLQTSRFRVEQLIRHDPQTGKISKEVIRHSGAVVIVPMVDEESVCLIKNFRWSVDETLVELPAGTLEPGEEPAATAARELTEETGFQAAHLRQLHAFYLSPGILDERMHLFVATGLTPGQPALVPGEQIDNLVVPWREAVRMVHDHRIHDAKTIIGLLLYDRLRS